MNPAVSTMLFLVLAGGLPLSIPLKAEDPILEAGNQPKEANVAFERHQFTVGRHRGRIFFDGKEAAPNVLESKSKEIRLIEIFDGQEFRSDRQFHQWAQKIRGTRTYTYDQVTRVAADGSTIIQPLVFFSEDQRSALDIQWNVWLAKRRAEIEEANRVRLAAEQEAERYQQQLHLQDLQAQILNAQAAAAERAAASLDILSGATSLWEVELVPAGTMGNSSTCTTDFVNIFSATQLANSPFGGTGRGLTAPFSESYIQSQNTNSIYVRAVGSTSQAAYEQALQTHPGYRTGSIRKLAGY